MASPRGIVVQRRRGAREDPPRSRPLYSSVPSLCLCVSAGDPRSGRSRGFVGGLDVGRRTRPTVLPGCRQFDVERFGRNGFTRRRGASSPEPQPPQNVTVRARIRTCRGLTIHANIGARLHRVQTTMGRRTTSTRPVLRSEDSRDRLDRHRKDPLGRRRCPPRRTLVNVRSSHNDDRAGCHLDSGEL